MIWTLKLEEKALKQFQKLDKPIQQKIRDYFRNKILIPNNPYMYAKKLTGDKAGHVSYRVGDYRIIAKILDSELIVLALRISHRKDVYSWVPPSK